MKLELTEKQLYWMMNNLSQAREIGLLGANYVRSKDSVENMIEGYKNF